MAGLGFRKSGKCDRGTYQLTHFGVTWAGMTLEWLWRYLHNYQNVSKRKIESK